jgi:hypothetical protein
MIDVVNKRCQIYGCNKIPTCNNKGQSKGIFCAKHKMDDMIDVVNKRCNSCGLFHVKARNNFLCSYCNPDKTKRQRTKEFAVKKLLDDNGIPNIHNKTVVNDCCLKYRPDFVIDCDTYFIVLEVDENAHNHYEPECEMVRMNNISVALGLPTKFVRYNPDLKGVDSKRKEAALLDTIKTLVNKPLLESIEPIYLFYSEICLSI